MTFRPHLRTSEAHLDGVLVGARVCLRSAEVHRPCPARVRSRRISRSNPEKIASKPAMARPAGVGRSSAPVKETTPHPGAPVPGGSPAGPSPTGLSDPVARPGPHRSPADGPPRSVSRGPLASQPRSSPRGLAGRSSSRAGPHSPAWRGSAWAVSADRL